MTELIEEKQQVFIEFLKRHGIYRMLETTNVMQKMFTVWEKAKRDEESRKPRKLHDIIDVHCYHCHKEGTYDRIKSDSKLKLVTTGNGTNVGYSTRYICYDCYTAEHSEHSWNSL